MKNKLFKSRYAPEWKCNFYYLHRTEGWLVYYQGTWQHSLIDAFGVELLELLKPATARQFQKKYKKNLRRSVKTALQRHRRALERFRKVLSGEVQVDDSEMMLGG